MKKAFFFAVAMMVMCSTAYGAAVDASGSWLMTIPFQTKTVLTVITSIQASTQTFSLSVDASGNVNHIQTSQPTGEQYGTDGIYHTVKTRPPNSGTVTTNGAGVYNIDANATSGLFVGASGRGAGYLMELAIHTYEYRDASDDIVNGIHARIVDIGAVLTTGEIVYSTVNVFFHAQRVVPIPSAFWLLASALTGLIAFREKFKKG